MPHKTPEARAAYYQRTKAAHSERNARTRARNAAHIRAAKDAPCTDCGVRHPHYVMQFDHVRGEKLGNVSEMQYVSIARLDAEIAKCEIVCANCHSTRTWLRLAAAGIVGSANKGS